MNDVDRVFTLLYDGRWHDVDEISSTTGLVPELTSQILSFLHRYGFVEYDRRGRRGRHAKLVTEWLDSSQNFKRKPLQVART